MLSIDLTIEKVLMNCRGGSRKTKIYCEQVLNLTTTIELGFDNEEEEQNMKIYLLLSSHMER